MPRYWSKYHVNFKIITLGISSLLIISKLATEKSPNEKNSKENMKWYSDTLLGNKFKSV